jgi:hypothetical protein
MDRPIYYAGIGSRQTPTDVLDCMKVIGYVLAKSGFVLRSGAADGADSAFEQGCDRARGRKQIFLPWSGFNGRNPDYDSVFSEPSQKAIEMASRTHPTWHYLKQGAQKLHARNCHQIFGLNVGCEEEKSKLVICWTPGTTKGGTEQALRLARQYNILIVNIASLPPSSMLLDTFGTVFNFLKG